MSNTSLKAAVLDLPEPERAEIAREILNSLQSDLPGGPISSDAWREVWRREAMARDAELDADESEGLPGEDVLREARLAVAERKRARRA